MAQRGAKSRKKHRRQGKTAAVRKLSPEQPAARDEGPRLIPLGPGKDAGVGRIEHYLELADKALGHAPVKAPGLAPQISPATAQIPAGLPGVENVEEAPLAPMEVPPPAAPPGVFQPPHPPAFPRPPKLSLPKPPRRKNTS